MTTWPSKPRLGVLTDIQEPDIPGSANPSTPLYSNAELSAHSDELRTAAIEAAAVLDAHRAVLLDHAAVLTHSTLLQRLHWLFTGRIDPKPV